MPAEPVKYIGDKLVVGQLDYSFLPAVPAIPGTTVLNGPVWIGAGGPQIPIANCMIGPGLHPITLQITGITNIAGVVNRVAVTNVVGLTSKIGATLRAALSATTGVSVKSALNTGSSINVFTSVIVDKTCVATKFIGDITATTGINPETVAEINLAKALPAKPFDIPHPSKENHRLRHVAIEGPEIAVFYRGKLDGEHIIKLPEYWKDLVHEDSITVQLTAWKHADPTLYVKNITLDEIAIGSENLTKIYCHYTVYAERKDIDKLIVEYEGQSVKDYPGQDFIGVNR